MTPQPAALAALALLASGTVVGSNERPTSPGDREEAAGLGGEVTRQEAEELLRLARQLRWTFPTSSGSPVRPEEARPGALDRVIARAGSLGAAVRLLLAGGDDAAAVELVARTWRVFVVLGEPAAGRAQLAAVLDGEAAGAPTRERALALYGDGLLAFRQGDLAGSLARNEAALAAARAAADREALALAHLGLSRVAFERGDFADARELAAEARRQVQGLEPALEQAPLHMLAQATRLAGDLDQAASLLEQSLALNRRLADRAMVVVELHNLGHVEIRRGAVERAEARFRELAALGDPDDAYGRAMADLNLAVVALARGDRERAAALLRRIDGELAASGTRLAIDDQRELDGLRARLQKAPGERPVTPPRELR